jgi:peptidoglycan/LPS O-acetylase OafA/YrhL
VRAVPDKKTASLPSSVETGPPTTPASGFGVPDTKQRFESLDALRGICALLVALYHFRTAGWISSSAVVRHSYIFVDYFFVLSGFVISFSYGDKIESRRISVVRFMGLRLGRLYPLHIAIIAALVLIEIALASFGGRGTFVGERSPSSLVENIFMLQSFGFQNSTTWNGPSWSISAEVWTYLLFGVVLLVPRRLILWLAGALSVSALCFLATTRASIDVTFDLGFIRCVYGFGLGFVLYHLFRKVGPKGGAAAEIASLVFAVIFVAFANGPWTFAAPPVFAVGIYLLASARGPISKILSSYPFQFLGMASYSIYMIHVFVAARLMQILHFASPQLTKWNGSSFVVAGSPMIGDVFSIIYALVVVGCSYVTYRLIEYPGREFTRKWLNRRERTAAVHTTHDDRNREATPILR